MLQYGTKISTAKQAATSEPQYRRWRKLRFCVASLDQLLKGGISSRGIVEIAGDSGSGKTQLALHLAIASQIQPANSTSKPKGVVYISTEHPFPSKRLFQMAQSIRQNHSEISEGKQINFGDHIFVEHLNNALDLEQCIALRLPVLLRNNPISLLVIDSIAAVYMEERNYVNRASSFRRIVRDIHALQERFDFATVCTNQVRCVFDNSTLDDDLIIPALGLAWSSLIHTRIQLTRPNRTNRRICHLLFSPTAPIGRCHFVITSAGIQSS